ncbi:MAG: hypothetical protein CBC48_01445 [bacterium TMED88]|nr:hypothetical protein [Deltaproteobacteria bacterium]OUV36829.1 MAG: hypothetical protein CBC48_01445 [bacterium TMED88]
MKAASEIFNSPLTPGIKLHMLKWGPPETEPVILLHGGGANAHWWDHLAPRWADDNRLIALDFRGHGDSDSPDTLQVGAFNLDLEALCDRLGESQVTLIGHSMGAHVALDHASRSERVRGLALVDPARGGPKRSRRAARLALALRRNYPSEKEAIERFRFVPSAEHCDEALRRSIAIQSVRAETGGRFGFKFDPRWFGVPGRPPPDCSAVRCPTLVIRGEESSILSAEGAQELCTELPESHLETVPGAGHHVLLDQPDAFSAIVKGWLDGLPRPSGKTDSPLG